MVNVCKEAVAGEKVGIRGDLSEGQLVVKRATDEIREGTKLR